MPPADNQTGTNALLVVGEPEGTAFAGEELDRETELIAELIRCPSCQGLSIATSPTDIAQDMKGEVRDLLAAGFNEDQIFRYFEASYGEFIRLEPKAEGFNLVVWLAPGLGLLLGAAIIGWRLRSSPSVSAEKRPQANADDGEGEGADVDPELAAYLEQVRQDVGMSTVPEDTVEGESP